jgi:hypothetical protein
MFFELAMAREAFDEAERLLDVRYGTLAKPAPLPRSPTAAPEAMMRSLEWSHYQGQRAVIAARRGRGDEARRLLADAEAEVAKVARVLAGAASPAATNARGSDPSRDFMLPVVESTVLSIELAWARPIAEARLAAIGR